MADILASDTDLIVFDGECVLCSSFFQFILRHDRDERFRFATAQSPLGQQLYTRLNLPTKEFETNLVIVDGKAHQKLDAFAAAMQALPGAWRVLSLCRFLPSFLKNPLYRIIARNRYALFGRREMCLVPDSSLISRFAPDGF
ncbi:MAG: thiol-disulfide oxidoreductase DCC family protein [Ruegeria sp.]